ncbi:hypothetical protein BH09PAT1_BH09PAT1_1100 [soil metagenome]
MPKVSTLIAPSEVISSENLYTLSINRKPSKTIILMRLLIPEVNTCDFPMTRQLLGVYLPSIFTSICYNEDHLSFSEEVARTEVGHLFEHILLEFLCIIKLENGLNSATYEGVTDWNWVRDPKGTFHITIKAKSENLDILNEAITRTITLTNIILTKDLSVNAPLMIPSSSTRH